MYTSNKKNISSIDDDEIDFIELFRVIWQGKWYVIFVTTTISILAIIYSLSLPNIYHSKALLSPVSNQSGLNQALGNYSTIANIAGINLQQNSDTNAIKSLEKLNTLSFFEENILPNIFLPDLLAVESWNQGTNKIIYNKEIYDQAEQIWVRDAKYPRTKKPSAQEAFKVFLKNNLLVSKDIETGFVSIGIKHQSPFIAKKWTEIIVDQLNDSYRKKDKAEAHAAIAFLNIQMVQTSFAEIKQVIAELIKQKTQQLTLIEVSEFYVFEYLDPPAVMENKSEPKRSLICIFGAFIGVVLGMFLVTFRHYAFDRIN